MERINSIKKKGKRPLERGDDDDEDQQERLRLNSRPALAGVIIEAQKVDCIHCSSLEPTIRRVVNEEVQRVLAELRRTLLIGRSSPQRIKGPDVRNLQLHFKSRLSLSLFTGGKVEGEQGAAIHVELMDANSVHVVTSGPESSAKLDVVVLEGDFNNEDDAGWSREEFDSHVVKERDGKRPLLIGDLQVTLKKGVGKLGDLTFTDNSSWIRSKKFRLGLKVSLGYCEGIRIREAKTEAFAVKDHRGELYKKHYPPTLIDEVWRLKKIMKDGPFHKKLNNAGICTVENFLRLVVRDSQELRNILGNGMSNKMWDALVEHARTCVLSEKLYVYYPDDPKNVGVVFNNIYELSGLVDNDQYFPKDSLSDSQKVDVDTWVKKAYANWKQIVEYEGNQLLNFKKTKKSSTSQSDLPLVSVSHPHTLDNQLPPSSFPVSGPFEPSLVNQNVPVGGSGYNDNMTQLLNSSTCSQFEPASSTQQVNLTNQITGTTSYGNGVGFALSPSHSSPSDFDFHLNRLLSPQMDLNFALSPSLSSPLNFSFAPGPYRSSPLDPSFQQAIVNPFENQHWYNYQYEISVNQLGNECSIDNASLAVPEVEMQHLPGNEFNFGNISVTVPQEMLSSKDRQHLLQNFDMGGHASMNVPEDGFNFHSCMPSHSPGFSPVKDGARVGEAVIGWLKLKAVLRWGIFIRKKAAERRAQLVELDDE